MQKRTSLFQLFWVFFKIGAFTFGGGYAMISIIEREIVAVKKWATPSDMMDMLIIAESTPGILAVNMATYCGLHERGILGSIVATLGVILPSFFITLGLSFAINAFKTDRWYGAAFAGIQICVCTLIVNAFIKIQKGVKKDWFSSIVLVVCFATALFTKFNVIFLIMIGAVLGVLAVAIGEKFNKTVLQDVSTQQTSVDEKNLDDGGEN